MISESYVLKSTRLMNKYKMLLVLIGMVLAMTLLNDVFMTYQNITNILRQISINTILAMGLTFAICIGGIDLSVGSLLAVSGVIVTDLIKNRNVSLLLAIPIGILASGILGSITGFTIAKSKAFPFVITLAMQAIARGIAYVYCDGAPIVDFDPSFLQLGQGSIGPVPIPALFALGIAGISAIIMNLTRIGRYIFAIGGNREAARVSGINSDKITTFVFTYSGLLAGLAGILLASRINAGQPQAGISYESDAIAAAVIGGTSLKGGVATIVGTLIGAIVIGVINNSLNLLGVSQYAQLIAKGLVIAVAVIIDVKTSHKY